MTAIDRHPDVIQMAANLGLDWRENPVAAIIAYCKGRIREWGGVPPRVCSLGKLEELVCRKLGLVIEEFCSEAELDTLTKKYIAKGEIVFAAQRNDFDESTFATLIRRDHATPTCPDRFVALIDCRGDKAARRFFTRWHEIAHVLTLVNGQMKIPFHRSTNNRDAVEQLMDKIAAEIGFSREIFQPVVDSAIADGGSLSFEMVERIRLAACPVASFQATLIAVMNHCSIPAVSLEAGLGFKKGEHRMITSPGLFPSLKPEAKLRVLTVGGNHAANETGIRIHRNMRVPDSSVIARLFHSAGVGTLSGVENLSDWTTSDGNSIGHHSVSVEARRRGDVVVGLICLPPTVLLGSQVGSRSSPVMGPG